MVRTTKNYYIFYNVDPCRTPIIPIIVQKYASKEEMAFRMLQVSNRSRVSWDMSEVKRALIVLILLHSAITLKCQVNF